MINVAIKPKKKLANIELLRIMAMVLIVTNHFSGHGLKLMDYDFDNPCSIFNWLVRGIGYMGTNLFILISAYFLCKSSFKTKGVLLLFAQTLFYSVIIYFITYFLGWHELSVTDLIKVFLPLTTSQYWFVTCYVVLYFLSPFLNLFVETLVNEGKRAYQSFILILLVFFSVIPTFFYFSSWVNWGSSSGIVWFTVLYFIGAYIRHFVPVEVLQENKRKIWMWTIFFWCLPLFSKLVIAYSTYFVFDSVIGSSVFYVKNSVILVPASILTFLAFFTIDIKNKRAIFIINKVATSIFAVYLIHDNGYVREKLWGFVAGIVHPDSYTLIVETFFVVLGIFCACLFIDIFRKIIFGLITKTNLPQCLTAGVISKLDKLLRLTSLKTLN